MPVRTQRFPGRAPPPALFTHPTERSANIRNLARGLHAGASPEELPLGYTPDARNVVHLDGSLQPRSGLSEFRSPSHVSDAVLGVAEVEDTDRARYILISSATTLSLLHPQAPLWSALSYVGSDPPSGQSAPWRTTHIYDPTLDQNIVVTTNEWNTPKWFQLGSRVDTFSDFTAAFSLLSHARDVVASDDRLVFFSTRNDVDAGKFLTRAVWSARGAPQTFSVASGAGARDLMDMDGAGLRAVPEGEGFLLFSEFEVWRGRPRRDVFAFDFHRVADGLSTPYASTIVSTPLGVIFLARDLDVYLVNGNDIRSLGRSQAPSVPENRIQDLLEREMLEGTNAWALYNAMEHRYELYYPTSVGAYPDRALFYDLDDDAWWPQRFPFQLSAGADLEEPNEGTASLTWDSVPDTWDSYATAWDHVNITSFTTGPRHVHAFSSAGTPYRFLSSATDDAGSVLDARWRSGGLAPRSSRMHALVDCFLDHASTSASTLALLPSDDLGNTFQSGVSTALSATSHQRVHAPLFLHACETPMLEVRWDDGGSVRLKRLDVRTQDEGVF